MIFFSRLRSDWCLLLSQHVKATTRYSSSFGMIFYVRCYLRDFEPILSTSLMSCAKQPLYYNCEFIDMDEALISPLLGVNVHRLYVAESTWPQNSTLLTHAWNLIEIMKLRIGVKQCKYHYVVHTKSHYWFSSLLRTLPCAMLNLHITAPISSSR